MRVLFPGSHSPDSSGSLWRHWRFLWPRQSEFSADPNELIRNYIEVEETAPIQELYRELALHMHRSYFENLEGLTTLATLFQIASVLVVTEMVLWIVAIASTA